MDKPELTRRNVRTFSGQKIKCHYHFIANEGSKDGEGNLILSEDLILDIEEGTFNASDFYLIN